MNVAPSEEFILHCDVPGCWGQLSMIADIPRKDHGWGCINVGGTVTGDYDLCPVHLQKLKDALGIVEHIHMVSSVTCSKKPNTHFCKCGWRPGVEGPDGAPLVVAHIEAESQV